MYEVFASFVKWLWGIPLLGVILVAGIYLTIKSKGFQFRYFGLIVKNIAKRDQRGKGEGKESLSPFQAVCIAVGGSVGVSNISGVATAIATGGPGALLWLWVAAFLGMIIKMAEVSLAVYYRTTMPDGSHRGGPTYYIEKALGEQKGWKAWFIPAGLFGAGLYINHFITLQNYTVSEAIGSQFDIPLVIPGFILLICIYLIILGGLKKIGEIAGYLVPFMCIFYCGCAIAVLVIEYKAIPEAFALIFRSAFNGTAAMGGFTGASVATAMRLGFARSVYSNEAGWGTSPMVHAAADTDHPIKQGLFGAFEVFADTICVCSATGLVVIVTGQWNSGLQGATLTLSAFECVLGKWASIIIALSVFMFALTTCAGWFTYYKTIIEHFLLGKGPKWEKVSKIWLKLLRWNNPVPGFLLCVYTVYVGATPAQLWTFADFNTLLPTFINVFVVILLGGKFIELLKDYKARYLGVGKVDENMHLFYEDEMKSKKKTA